MAHAGLLLPQSGPPVLRSRQSRPRLSIRPCRSRQLRVRASDDAEPPKPEQQPEEAASILSDRRLLLMAGAASIASALPMWLSMAVRKSGRAHAATLADQQVLLQSRCIILCVCLPALMRTRAFRCKRPTRDVSMPLDHSLSIGSGQAALCTYQNHGSPHLTCWPAGAWPLLTQHCMQFRSVVGAIRFWTVTGCPAAASARRRCCSGASRWHAWSTAPDWRRQQRWRRKPGAAARR